MKRIFSIAACSLLLAAIALGSWRIVEINQKYPAAEEVAVPRGETMHFLDSTYTVTDAKILTMEELLEAYPAIGEDEGLVDFLPTIDKMLLVTVAYTGDMQQLVYASAESESWANAMLMTLSNHVNHGAESGTVVLPFDLIRRRFPGRWETLSVSDFSLVLSVYPEKYVLCL